MFSTQPFIFSVVVFAAGRTAHQFLNGLFDIAVIVENGIDLVDDGGFRIDLACERISSFGGGDAFGNDHSHFCEDLREFASFAQFFPDMTVAAVTAAAGDDQIADAA